MDLSGITIGVDRIQYAEQRNIVLPNTAEGRVVRQVDTIPVSGDFGACYSRFAVVPRHASDADFFHLFNSIPLRDCPFVVTTEAGLPRWWGAPPEIMLDGWRRLASSACGRILAISQNAARMIAHELNACPQALRQEIEAKLEVLLPPQEIPPQHDRAKFRTRGPLRLAFVGRDFLRKGGYQFVCALQTLARRNIAFHATIVANMRVTGEPEAPWNQNGARHLAQTRAMLAALGDRVEFHETLPNRRVLDLFGRSHVALLPSLSEPFGYTVLEAASQLCPVLTTNIRAFPEINGDDCGWMVPLPVMALGILDCVSTPFEQVSLRLHADLAETIAHIADTGLGAVGEKAEAALARVCTCHDPAAAGARLTGIYSALRPRRRRAPPARMRVLWVTANFAPQIGGLQTYTASMISALAADMDIMLVTDAAQTAPPDKRILHVGLKNLGAADSAAALARTGSDLCAAATALGADIVHFANANMAVYRRFLPPALPVVASVHGNDLTAPWQRIGGEDPAPYIRAGLATCERIIAVSRHTQELIQKAKIPVRVNVIQNSCDQSRFFPSAQEGNAIRFRYGIAPDCLALLTVGRLVPRKGHATVIAALGVIGESVPGLCWIAAGDGPLRSLLEAQAAREAPAVRAIFIGHVEDAELRAVYNACDIFVLAPSALRNGALLDSEGFGIAFLEAAACGKPVIGADLAGCRDAVVQGHTGLLLPPDDPEALAAGITFLAQNPKTRAALGGYGLAALQACGGWADIAARVHGIYEEVLTECASSMNLLRNIRF